MAGGDMIRCMWRVICVAMVMAVSVVAAASEAGRLASWAEVAKAAKTCSTKAIRQSIPKGLDAVPHGPAYRLDHQATPKQRQCFYGQLNMGEAEQTVREMQFEKK
jgi:hypothetical protein